MTKKNTPTPTPETMMTQLRTLVIDTGASNATRLRALELAYELGKAAGHFDGAVKMATDLTADFTKNLDKAFSKESIR
jgi:hypothetical protein